MLYVLDHLVLTTRNLRACLNFYTDVLGMRLEQLGDDEFGRSQHVLCFGSYMISVRERVGRVKPSAYLPMPGSLDLCFLTDKPLSELRTYLVAKGCVPVLGPVRRKAACGPVLSLFVRDPDMNLIEIAEPLLEAPS